MPIGVLKVGTTFTKENNMLKQTIKTKWLEELRNGGHEQVPGTLKAEKPDDKETV